MKETSEQRQPQHIESKLTATDIALIENPNATHGEMLGKCLSWLVTPRGANNYYGRVLLGCKMQPTTNGTAAVMLDPYGKYTFCWSPEWFESISMPFRLMVLMHEAAHLALGHLERMLPYIQDLSGSERAKMVQLCGIAMDMAVNDSILREFITKNNAAKKYEKKFSIVLEQGVLPEREGYPRGKSFEYYLDCLLKDVKKQEEKEATEAAAGSGAGSENESEDKAGDTSDNAAGSKAGDKLGNKGGNKEGSKPGNGPGDKNTNKSTTGTGSGPTETRIDSLDKRRFNHGMDPFAKLDKNLTPEEITTLVAHAKRARTRILRTAADATTRQAGVVPGDIIALLANLEKEPSIPWTQVLKLMMQTLLSDTVEPSSVSPNISLLDLEVEGIIPYPGYQTSPTCSVIAFIDTSGSVSDTEFKLFMVEIRALLDATNTELRVIMFDERLQTIHVLDTKNNPIDRSVLRSGYGGTSFTPAFRYACNLRESSDWVNAKMPAEAITDTRPNLVIILTDGYAPITTDTGGPIPHYTPECPVLWVLTPTGKEHTAMLPNVLHIN